ncbi:hypothetical protein [Mycolicibacterium doricum]|uniref:hypothetical protein n=1 Tax=Mycolicibacterium doricum TaxID=126673 RepID=UPI000D6CC6CF|nr:hypothetical protein [Mycolicibacterium doricum]MCV7269250.1 hypothetical protein [Mycolicibacterium doricum]
MTAVVEGSVGVVSRSVSEALQGRRRQSEIGMISPVEFEDRHNQTAQAACPVSTIRGQPQAALNRWCLSVTGSMMGCVAADGGLV